MLLILVSAALQLQAQGQPPDPSTSNPITTDRPSFTASSIVVPVGSLQFENGFLETTAQSQTGFDFPETLVRFGILAKTELRFTAPDYYDNYNTGLGFGSGFGDLLLGFKQQLGPAGGFDVSLIGSVSLPTGANILSSHGYDPQLQLPWSRQISKNWTIAGMLGLLWPTQGPSTGNLPNPGTPSSNTLECSRSGVAPSRFCIWARHTKLRRNSNSIFISALVFPRPRRITSSGSATRFASKCFTSASAAKSQCCSCTSFAPRRWSSLRMSIQILKYAHSGGALAS